MLPHPSEPQVHPFKPLTKEDVADVLGITTRCVEKWVDQGVIPRWQKLGDRSLWHPDVFYGWLHRHLRGDAPAEVIAQSKPVHTARAVKKAPASCGAGALSASRLARIEQLALDAVMKKPAAPADPMQ